MSTVDSKIPAGLICAGMEFFFTEGDLYCTYEGSLKRFLELPPDKLEELHVIMLEDEDAMDILNRIGPSNKKDQLFLYYKCRCGGLDDQSDLIDGVLSSESWNCDCNGRCILQGHFHDGALTRNGFLTKRELEVTRVLAQPPYPTAIMAADMLDISPKTLENHKSSIFYKTGCKSIQELTALAAVKSWI